MRFITILYEDIRQNRFEYFLYFLQILLAAVLAVLVFDLDNSLNSRGCRYAVNMTETHIPEGMK